MREYPGARKHQYLLKAIEFYYQDDPRILAVSVFGSLGRGNWDQFSDLAWLTNGKSYCGSVRKKGVK